MKKIILILVLILTSVGIIFLLFNKNSKITNSLTTPSQESSTRYIKSARLKISIPNGFMFSTQEQLNLTTQKPYSVTFTIQNYKNTINETKTPYQLYAIYQWDNKSTTQEEFLKSDFSLDPSTRKEFIIDKHPAVSGNLKGDRARFTTYIFNNGHVLILAASETTKQQREITNNIIQSIKFN